MHTRLTKEGRAIRGAFFKLIGWMTMIIFATAAISLASRTIGPSLAAWWNTPRPPVPVLAAASPRTAPKTQASPPPPRYTPPAPRPMYIPPSGGHVEVRRYEIRWPWQKKPKEKRTTPLPVPRPAPTPPVNCEPNKVNQPNRESAKPPPTGAKPPAIKKPPTAQKPKAPEVKKSPTKAPAAPPKMTNPSPAPKRKK